MIPQERNGRLREKLNDRLNELRLVKAQVRTEQKALIEAETNVANTQEAQKILQACAEAIQKEAHNRIAGVVTRCLEAVFGEEAYTFRIDFSQKRGRTEAALCFARGELVLDDPINEAGGGAVEIGAFALRVACLMLQRPPLRRTLILDEPFKNVRGKHYRQRVRQLILKLSEEMDVQFILNVDADAYPEFLLGEVVELE